ncbi:MAG: hypothetical protein CMG46_00700 [Candidatus Marinimicrobia bacterium]|nr:hypothetical protein [Candidatus Neomarinimicrobiota bacterium]
MQNCNIKILFYVFLLMSIVFTKNLTLHDYDNPSATHILDSEIIGDILIVSGMIGGIEFYDISNRENLNHLTNLHLSGGGGGGGQGGGTKPNCIVASGNYAYVTTNRGLGVINISNPSNPQYLGIVSNTDDYILEDLDVSNDLLAVSAHEDGTLLFDISNPSNPSFISSVSGENVWTVSIVDDFLYIGDQNILSIYSLTIDPFNNSVNVDFLLDINLSNSIKDIETSHNDDYIFVALGSDGVVLVDYIIENNDYEILDVFNTSALANKIDFFNETLYAQRLAVSDWDDVEIIEWDGLNLNLVGYKNTTRRTMGISVKDEYVYSSEWASVQIFEYGEIEGPDIDLSTYELNFPYVQNGESFTMQLDVINNGNSELNILDAYTTNDEFGYSILNNLMPGELQIIDVTYTANANNSSGSYRIFSNDSDEYEIICETNGNINGANIGGDAPDFSLDIIANGQGLFTLSDYIGQVVILAFFAPN